MREYFVYMLRCSDGSYYIGVTSNLDERFAQHQDGWDPKAYTHDRRPVTLVYSADFDDVYDAIAWEKRIKGWSRKKKEVLIAREYEKLPKLARTAQNYWIYHVTKHARFHVMLSLSKHGMKAGFIRMSPFDKLRVTCKSSG